MTLRSLPDSPRVPYASRPATCDFPYWAEPHTEEFYEVTDSSFDIAEVRDELLAWEQIYNTVRPHQALDYMTPPEFLEHWKRHSGKEDVSLII